MFAVSKVCLVSGGICICNDLDIARILVFKEHKWLNSSLIERISFCFILLWPSGQRTVFYIMNRKFFWIAGFGKGVPRCQSVYSQFRGSLQCKRSKPNLIRHDVVQHPRWISESPFHFNSIIKQMLCNCVPSTREAIFQCSCIFQFFEIRNEIRIEKQNEKRNEKQFETTEIEIEIETETEIEISWTNASECV